MLGARLGAMRSRARRAVLGFVERQLRERIGAHVDSLSVTHVGLAKGGARLAIALGKGRSSVTIDAEIGVRGALTGSTVRGRVFARDFLAGADPEASCDLEGTMSGTLAAPKLEVRAATPRSRVLLELALALAPASLLGSRVTGTLSFFDALRMGLFPGAITPSRRGAIALDLAIAGSLERPVVSGRLSTPQLDIVRRAKPYVPGYALRDVSAEIRASGATLTFRELAGTAYGGTFHGEGELRRDHARARLAFEDVGAKLLEALARDAIVKLPIAIPPGLTAAGELTLDGDRARGDVALRTETSELSIALAVDATGALEGAVRGAVSYADVEASGILGEGVRPLPLGELAIDAALRGTAANPTLAGQIASARVTLAVPEDREWPPFVLEGLSASFHAEGRSVAWRKLDGRAYGGTITGSGELSAAALSARLAWRGVRPHWVPTLASGESEFAGLIRGSTSGAIDAKREAGGPLTGRGDITISDPEYLVVKDLERELRRFGLPVPEMRGAGPLHATLEMTGTALHVRGILARVEGIDVDGELAVARSRGALRGTLRAHLLGAYLSRSVVLALPAVLANKLTIPITVTGTLRAPRFVANLAEALGGMLAENRVGDAVKGVVGDILEPRGDGRRRGRKR